MKKVKLFEDFINESIDVKYWADYNTDTSGQADPSHATKYKVFDVAFEEAVETWNAEADGKENQINNKEVDKIERLAKEFFKKAGWISINVIHAMIAQEGIGESIVNESTEEKEAKAILQDLLDEFDPWELHDMTEEEAKETVDSYGHKGTKAKKIAEILYDLASNGIFESKKINEAKALPLDKLTKMIGDKPSCYDLADFIYTNYDKVTGLKKSMRNDEMDFPSEIEDLVNHYKFDMDDFTDKYGMAAESIVNEDKKLDRDAFIALLKDKYKFTFVRTSEDFDGSKGGIWTSGESSPSLGGKKIYSYYSEGSAYELGVLKKFEDAINKLGWYSEWYDAGTMNIWPI